MLRLLFVSGSIEPCFDLLIDLGIHSIREQAQILLFDAQVCDVRLFSIPREKNEPAAVFLLLLPDHALHPLVHALFCIAFFFNCQF